MHLVFERSNGRFKSNCNILALAWMPYYVETKFRRALFDYHQLQLINLPNNSNNNNEQRNNSNNPTTNRPTNQNNSDESGGNINSNNNNNDSRSQSAFDNNFSGNNLNHLSPSNVYLSQSSGNAQLNVNNNGMSNEEGINNMINHAVNNSNSNSNNRSSYLPSDGNQSNSNNNIDLTYNNDNRRNINNFRFNHSNGNAFLNSRLAELNQRYYYAKDFRRPLNNNPLNRSDQQRAHNNQINDSTSASPGDELDNKYGRMPNFGWLVVGHIAKTVGITLTSVVNPPDEIIDHTSSKHSEQVTNSASDSTRKNSDDLIVFDTNDENENGCDHNLTTNNAINSNSVNSFSNNSTSPKDTTGGKRHTCDYERFRPDRRSVRNNYNLRGHLDEVIIVKWNELYQKLATVDTKGNVLIWCKINEKFTVQTPFYNRTKTVADFCWSNDGKTALICYTDAFILVGSSSGQRHWHSMLNLDDYHITCATWTPNDEQLLLGVSNGNVVLIDLARSELTELALTDVNVRTMCWSSSEMTLKHVQTKTDNSANWSCRYNPTSNYRYSTAIVNQRRLSRDCSVFSRAQMASAATQRNSDLEWNRQSNRQFDAQHRSPADSCHDASIKLDTLVNANKSSKYNEPRNILAVDLADNTIRLYANGLDDPDVAMIRVDLESYTMHWSSDGRILAVAGFNIHTSAPSIGCLRCKYLNEMKFYDQRGQLIYKYKLKHTRYPLTAFTWAHDDTRIFLATGPNLHCAKVFFGVPSLGLLAASCFQRHTRLPDKIDVLQSVLKNQFSPNIVNWQSFNCPFDLSSALRSRNSSNSFATADLSSSSTDDSSVQFLRPEIRNNVNLYRYHLPAKVLSKIDDLFALSIRQPFDEYLSLSDVAWQVPGNNQRLYCTLVCYSNENEICSNGLNRYGNNIEAQERTSSSSSIGSFNDQTTDQYKIFILYIEFLGSLIPILKARRVGFLKPEFVIFGSEERRGKHRRGQKISDSFRRSEQAEQNSRHLSDLISQGSSTEPYLTRQTLMNPSLDQALLSSSPVQSRTSGKKRFDLMVMRDFAYKNNTTNVNGAISPVPMMTNTNINGDMTTIANGFYPRTSVDQRSQRRTRQRSASYKLTETHEMVRIGSNIWGTKFKILSVGNGLIEQRAVLGTVIYKASLLHLQPRQVFLFIKNMSNYCTLCSTHHHSKMTNAKYHSSQSYANKEALDSNVSLLDVPNQVDLKQLEKMNRKNNRHKRTTNSGQSNNNIDNDKIIVPIGESLRVAPKLEHNQVYRIASRSTRAAPSSTSHLPRPSTSQSAADAKVFTRHRDRSGRSHRSNNLNNNSNSNLLIGENSNSAVHMYRSDQMSTTRNKKLSSYDRSSSTTPMDISDDSDVLTLSLGQGDQLRVEMKSLTKLDSADSSQSIEAGDRFEKSGQTDRMEDFLASNKTLKSIQAITKMIVDLSSKVDCDDDNGGDTDLEPQASPSKLIKLSDRDDDSIMVSPARVGAKAFVPPEAPVHRPRRNRQSSETGSCSRSFSQSATTTPLRRDDPKRRPIRLNSARGSSTSSTSSSSHRGRTNSMTTDDTQRYAIGDAPLPLPPSVPLGRRISSKAKRFLDGSLRSLYSAGSGGGGGYMSSSDVEPEEFVPLVMSSNSSRAQHYLAARAANRSMKHSKESSSSSKSAAQSQPTTPLRANSAGPSMTTAAAKWFQVSSSAARQSLQSQLLQRFRNQTGWHRDNSAGRPHEHRNSREFIKRQNSNRATPVHMAVDTSAADSSSSGGAPDDSSMEDLNHLDEPMSDSDDDGSKRQPLDRFNSLKNLSCIGGDQQRHGVKSNNHHHLDESNDFLTPTAGSNNYVMRRTNGSSTNSSDNNGSMRQCARSARRQQQARKSICFESNCCCAQEIKLRNRPPVWNEFSQVYQLDFGGRVTQESAKNLQIDFNGNLALQFGRIDRCTYALDYKYPFNAVQAMAIALASLTQRLK